MINSSKSICPKCSGQLKYYDSVKRIVRTKYGHKKKVDIKRFRFGKATRNGKLITNLEEMNSKYGRINFYISPKLLWQETGYVWKGERT